MSSDCTTSGVRDVSGPICQGSSRFIQVCTCARLLTRSAFNHCEIQVGSRSRTGQLAIDFPPPKPGWGGKRAGAGRPKAKNGRVPHARRAPLSRHHPVHVTLRMRPEVYGLRSGRSFRAVETSLRAMQRVRDARFVHYSVQGNHIHLIVEASDRVSLSRRIQGFEVRLAIALNRMMKRPRGKVFADRYHAHILKTPHEVHRALGYVLRNASKHYGRSTVVDAYSSAAWFQGWSAPVRIGWSPLEGRAPPISAPGSWLLRVGWKKHGPIDAQDVANAQSRVDSI